MSIDYYLNSKKNQIISFTKKLVEIPTINPPGENYEKIISVLEKKCIALGLKTTRIKTPKSLLRKYNIEKNNRVSLIAEWNVGAKKTLHFNGHYDVVPVTSNWKTDPFKVIVKDGRIYGRGVGDCKGNIVVLLFLIQALKWLKIKPTVNIQLSFTPDEETGGETGLGYIVKNNFIRPDYVVGEGADTLNISHGNKGVLFLEAIVSGKSCHACRPFKGINSFENMIKLANELTLLKGKISKRKTKYRTELSEEKSPTLVMGGVIRGGSKVNIVPDKCSFTIDRRILPEEGLAKAEKEILDIVNRLKKKDRNFKVKLKILQKDDPVIIDKKNELCLSLSNAIKNVYGKEANFILLAGATDMRFFIKKGIPAIGYGIAGRNAHGDNEYIEIKQMMNQIKVFYHLIQNLEKVGEW